MNDTRSKKQIIASIITALICGGIFAVIIPIIALFLIDVLITTAVLFDPLNQGKYIDQVWGAFIGIIILQIVFPVLASVATGVAITYLTEQVKTAWVYMIGIVVSGVIYCTFQFISIMFVGIFAGELAIISWMLVSIPIVGVAAIIIGLICVAVNRNMSGKNKLNS